MPETILNTYNFTLKPPLFPGTFFKVVFNCNGSTFISDSFNALSDALFWAQNILGDFGTWSIENDALHLEGSLCGVGSLGYLVQLPESEPEPDPDDDDPDDPELGILLSIDTSTVSPILDNYNIAAVDVSVKEQRALDSEFLGFLEPLHGLAIEPIAGTTAQWALFKTPSDGYNIVLSEVTARGYNIATLLGGVGNKVYGYGFFEDMLAVIVQLSPQPEIIITLNLIRPALLGSYTLTFAEIDYVVDACTDAGVDIKYFQLCYELGNQSNNDVFTTAQDIADVTQEVADYINTNHPTIPISADAANWDDNSVYFDGLSEAINTVTGITYVRQYMHLRETTFQANMDYITDGFIEMMNYFDDKFTNGQKLALAQPNTPTENPFRLKVGEALMFSKMVIETIKKNLETNNKIAHFNHYNLSRLISGTNVLYPCYYFMLLLRPAMESDGSVEFTYNDDSLDDLLILTVKDGANAGIYIVNPTGDFKQIDTLKVDDVIKSVTVETYYGDPSLSTALHYEASTEGILIYPHSLTYAQSV